MAYTDIVQHMLQAAEDWRWYRWAHDDAVLVPNDLIVPAPVLVRAHRREVQRSVYGGLNDEQMA